MSPPIRSIWPKASVTSNRLMEKIDTHSRLFDLGLGEPSRATKKKHQSFGMRQLLYPGAETHWANASTNPSSLLFGMIRTDLSGCNGSQRSCNKKALLDFWKRLSGMQP